MGGGGAGWWGVGCGWGFARVRRGFKGGVGAERRGERGAEWGVDKGGFVGPLALMQGLLNTMRVG